ncbi:MAG TPA: DUF4190 domain-containing protein [Lapillicoccus sp.]|nr:DUF4190 domain-containing protein [Lapillicoccus sp.]
MSNEGGGYPQDRPAQERPPTAPQYEQAPQYPQYQQPYAPPAYGAPGSDQVQFHEPGPALEHPQATLAFVLGLLSILGLTILGPFGWYIGNKVVGEIDRDGRVFANRGLAMAGKVLGIIGTVFLILSVLAFVAFIVFVVVAASTS